MDDVPEKIDGMDLEQIKLLLLDFGVDFLEIESMERLKAKLLDTIFENSMQN